MRIHILGIVGNMTAPLALDLKRLGHQVSGSDQEKIWPPYSTILKKASIPLNASEISNKIDLAIIGSSYKNFSRTQHEFDTIKSLKIPYLSATDYISQNVAKKNTILVAGSHGKTTITALLVWILKKAGLNPSYMFGGLPLNHFPSLKIAKSDWSVIEADESINGLDTQAKFLYYPLKHLILTSTNWEHKDSYPNQSANDLAYKQLVQRLKRDNFLVHHPSLSSFVSISPAQKIAYPLTTVFPNQLIGQFNQENISAATAMAEKIGISHQIIKSATLSFQGIKGRLQLLGSVKQIYFYHDLAQSSARISQSLLALHQRHPGLTIKVYFEPHASFLENKQSLQQLGQAFSLSSEVVLSRIKYSLNQANRTTFHDYKKEIGDKLKYIPITPNITQHYLNSLKPNTVLIYFCSGGSTGLKILKNIIRKLLSETKSSSAGKIYN